MREMRADEGQRVLDPKHVEYLYGLLCTNPHKSFGNMQLFVMDNSKLPEDILKSKFPAVAVLEPGSKVPEVTTREALLEPYSKIDFELGVAGGGHFYQAVQRLLPKADDLTKKAIGARPSEVLIVFMFVILCIVPGIRFSCLVLDLRFWSSQGHYGQSVRNP